MVSSALSLLVDEGAADAYLDRPQRLLAGLHRTPWRLRHRDQRPSADRRKAVPFRQLGCDTANSLYIEKTNNSANLRLFSGRLAPFHETVGCRKRLGSDCCCTTVSGRSCCWHSHVRRSDGLCAAKRTTASGDLLGDIGHRLDEGSWQYLDHVSGLENFRRF